MNLRMLLSILLGLSVTTHAASGAVVVLDFTSGTITKPHPWYPPDSYSLGGGVEYVEKGVTVTSVNAGEQGFPCFFLEMDGLNMALESLTGSYEFTAGGAPFDLISLEVRGFDNTTPVGPGDVPEPFLFTSSKGGSLDVSADGTVTFPNPYTHPWKNITSFQLNPQWSWGTVDNVTLDIIPEPSTISLFIIGGVLLLAAARKKGRAAR